MTYSVRKKDKTIKGIIQLNGSKSISNRVLIMEALAGKIFEKENISTAADTILLQELLSRTNTILDARDAGTTFRFLTAYLSLKEGEWFLLGSDRMKQRPIAPLAEALQSLGAEIHYLERKGFPPLKIRGGKMKGGTVSVGSSVSSQFASALLMIAPCLKNGLTLELTGDVVSEPYIEMTLSLMQHFGVHHTRNGNSIHVSEQTYHARPIIIESDWSAASYFYEIVAFADEAELTLVGLFEKSFQGDSVIASLMKKFGVQTQFQQEKIILTKENSSGKFDFDLKNFPDLAPAMIVACAGLSKQATFKGLDHLQFKESNREDALRNELLKCGIEMTRVDHEIHVRGKFISSGHIFETYNDHRLAMAFAPLALITQQARIDDPDVVSKSYPQFWKHLEQLGFEIDILK